MRLPHLLFSDAQCPLIERLGEGVQRAFTEVNTSPLQHLGSLGEQKLMLFDQRIACQHLLQIALALRPDGHLVFRITRKDGIHCEHYPFGPQALLLGCHALHLHDLYQPVDTQQTVLRQPFDERIGEQGFQYIVESEAVCRRILAAQVANRGHPRSAVLRGYDPEQERHRDVTVRLLPGSFVRYAETTGTSSLPQTPDSSWPASHDARARRTDAFDRAENSRNCYILFLRCRRQPDRGPVESARAPPQYSSLRRSLQRRHRQSVALVEVRVVSPPSSPGNLLQRTMQARPLHSLVS